MIKGKNTNNYNPKVSIIIPVYNGEKYMKEAIESALNQDYSNVEVIVVNDGSTDDTERIASAYGDKIKYYYKENGGVSSALNFGISKMSGEMFSWLSHDDVYEVNKVSSQIDFINKHNIDYTKSLISSNISFIDSNSKTIKKPTKKYKEFCSSERFLKELLNGNNIYGCCLLIHKSILDRIGFFDKNYVFIQDYLYWIKLAYNDIALYTLRQKLVKARRHVQQVTVTKKEYRNIEMEKSKYYLLELLKKDININNKKILQEYLKYNIIWDDVSPFEYNFRDKIKRCLKIELFKLKCELKRIIIRLLVKERK